MPKTAKRKSQQQLQPEIQSEATDSGDFAQERQAGETEFYDESPDNGHTQVQEEEAPQPAEPAPPLETPAKMKVQIEGTAGAVREAARKVGNQPVARPAVQVIEEPPVIDSADVLLADGRNMVMVRREFPKTIVMMDGSKRRCAVKLPDRYSCPTTREEVENDVFERYGGLKYKCTIHPATTNGENTLLGYFTIEHPNPEEPPYFEDQQESQSEMQIPGATDPTMRETDGLAGLKASLQRRLERAQQKKEIKELERMVEDEEDDGKQKVQAAPVPVGLDPRDQRITDLMAQLTEKKVDDRFTAMQNSIAQLTQTVQALAVTKPHGAEDPVMKFMLQKMASDDTRFSELMKVVTSKNSTVVPPPEDSFDKMLDRMLKLKSSLGGDDSKVGRLQDRLMDMAMDRVLDGGDGPVEEQDALKILIKEASPIIKSYVDKQVQKEESNSGEHLSKERLKEIYSETATKAAKDLEEKWKREGWIIRDPGLSGPGQRPGLPAAKKPGVPPREQHPPMGKVVARQQTSEGVVEKIQIQRADLSEKPRTVEPTMESRPSTQVEQREETEEVRYADMPGIGRVEVPVPPGDMKYDRKKSVNFVLDAILSEIYEGVPQKADGDPSAESCVPGDAIELLDGEILDQIYKSTSGGELDAALGAWGDRAKLNAITEAGKEPKTDSWLRRVIRTVQEVHRDSKRG